MQRVRQREGLDLKEAERRLAELDHHRADFIRRNFRADVNDPSHYDLVVDSSAFGIEGAVELIARAMELKAAKG
jgi:cytidylate kinase